MLRIISTVAVACLPLIFTPAIAAGDADAGANKAAVCSGCHGVNGKSVVSIYPHLAGQNAAYLELAIKAYQNKQRTGGNTVLMYPMVANLSHQDIADLAAYFAAQ